MQITTLEQLKEVKPSHTLFLINPFDNGNQSRVTIEKFTVKGVFGDKFTGRKEYKELSIDRDGSNYFIDMIGNCKYVYTIENEAISKLKDINKGLHHKEVKDHHDSCKEAYTYSDMC